MPRSWLPDAALAAVLTVASQVEISAQHMQHPVAAALSTVGVTLPLAVRRRWPALVGTLAILILIVQQSLIGDVEHASAFAVVAIAIAIYSLGRHSSPRLAATLGAIGLLAFVCLGAAKSKSVGDIVFAGTVMFAPWFVGAELRRRATREERLRRRVDDLDELAEHRARAAVEEERIRIARELHDVVAHAMSVIVVQAGAERLVLSDEMGSTRTVLSTIERTAREALGEMRRLVGMMRTDGELTLAPQPSVAYLADLCEQVRASGLPVELEVTGKPTALPPGVDVSAYRIVQEALTNALKHAGPAHARVRVTYGTDNLEIEISDDGQGAGSRAGTGHGLVGMRERVAVYGGALRAGDRTTGGYGVHVTLPMSEPLL